MITASHLLFQIAEVECSLKNEPKPNEAILACISLFRSIAVSQARKESSYIDLSTPID